MDNVIFYSLLFVVYVFISCLIAAVLSQSTKCGILLDRASLALFFFWWIILPIIAVVELIQGIKFVITGK